MDWTAPGVEEVAPGVHRIPLPMPDDGLRAVNAYAVLGRDGCTLVDGGWRIPAARDALDAGLTALGISPGDVERCLVTHHHRDHLTLAQELRETAGVRLALGEGERDNLAAARAIRPGRVSPQSLILRAAGAGPVAGAVARLLAGVRPPAPEDFADPDDWLADEEVVAAAERSFRVMSTPGHTRGHVVFVDDAAELMFAGDHVLPHITPSIGFELAPAASPLADYLTSLARTLAEPDRLLLPAHGPAGGSVRARTRELLTHHEQRLAATEAAVRDGAGTGYDVSRVLRWTRRERHLDDLDPFNQMLAVCETVAHLEVLATQGRVRRAEEGDVTTWAA